MLIGIILQLGFMNKIEIFKKALYQLVGSNQELTNKIKESNDEYDSILELVISDDKSSSAWYKLNKIILGIKMLPRLYQLCEDISQKFDIKVCLGVDSKYSDYEHDNIRELLSIYNNEVTDTPPSLILGSILFLSGNCENKLEKVFYSAADTLVLFALDYSICHEVGHLLKDDESKSPIEKEQYADNFAFHLLKEMYQKEMHIDEGLANSRKIGTFLGIASVLYFRKPEEDNDDKGHPHTIERMYSMLNNWQVESNSLLWEIGCYIIGKWTDINGMLLPWDTDESLSYQDKFMCAYKRINKEHQYV